VLLTGARGTGKSSLVKACLNAYRDQGLRLIEVDKADLVDLPDIVEVVAGRPERFIVFCDDLSFEEGESGYKALKSILDGSVAAASPNVLIYATSNRRHLLPEYLRENLQARHGEDGEVHPAEAVEEKISLSERFGLWVSFYPFSQDEYLSVVRQWLLHYGVPPEAIEAARASALVWALERGSRSGRVAYQFARDYAGRERWSEDT
jgi:predicted AAA+ superfamily ATPase